MSWCLFSSWVCFGFCFSASRSRCLSWKGKRLRAMTHRMPTTSPRLVAIQEMMTTGDSLSVWIMYATYSETMALQFQSWMPTNTIAVTASIPRRMMDSHRLAFRALSLLIFWACSSSSCSFLSIQEFCSFEVEFEGRFGGFVVGVQYGGGSRTRSCPVFGGCRGVVGVLFFLDGIGSGGERLAVGGHQLAE